MSGRPGETGGGELGEIPYLRPHPGAALFARRADRFGRLAAGHVLGDLLEFCGRLSAAQAAAAAELAPPAGGSDAPAARPLDAATWRRDEWIPTLRTIARELASAPMPAPARAGLDRLSGMDRDGLAALSAGILSRSFAGLDLAAVPFAAAALQVQFAAAAAGTPVAGVAPGEGGCPLCGSPPVAGVVLGDDKLRYLACSLCGSQWHLTRVKCSSCGSTAGISYLSLDSDAGGVKAEVCDGCRGYVKLLYLEQRPEAEPAADDLATVALDLLVAEQGYARNGLNLFLPA